MHDAGAILELEPDTVTALVEILYEVEQCGGSMPPTSMPPTQFQIHTAAGHDAENHYCAHG